MKHLSRSTLAIIALVAIATVPATAQIPRTISFQGVLADASGALIPDGPQDLTISIYDVATGGTPLFSETQRVTVVRGVFNAIIGTTDPAGIPAAIAFDMPYYLGVRVGSGTELSPRTPFTSVPYALNAAMAQRAIVADRADSAMWAQTSVTSDTTMNIVGGHVSSVNGQQGAIEFLGQGATTVTRNGNQITIRSTDAVGGIQRIDNFDGSLVIDPPQGPFVTMFIREGGIQTHHLRDMSVTTSKLAIGAVGTNQIADAAITNPKLAPNAVTSDKIMDATIATADLADNSVTSPKIVDGEVMNADLGASAVTSDKILDATIVTADLADNSVTSPKIVDGQVLTQDVGDAQITNPKLAANAVTTDKIMDATIATADIGANQIDASRITTAGATTAGQTLIFNGATTPVWGNPTASDLILPFAKSVNSASTLFAITNTGTGRSITGTANAMSMVGRSVSTGPGVVGHVGTSFSYVAGSGVAGYSDVGPGVSAVSQVTTGIVGLNFGATGGAANFVSSGPATNLEPTLIASNFSGGSALRVEILGAANTSTAATFATAGTGRVATFNQTNAAATASAVEVNTVGLSNAGTFTVSSSANGNNAIAASTIGTGRAISASILPPAPGGSILTWTGRGVIHADAWGTTNADGIQATSRDANGIVSLSGGQAGEAAVMAVAIFGTANGLISDVYGSPSTTTENNPAIFRANGANVARIDRSGTGYFNNGTVSSGADVAESFAVEGDRAAYEPGDVLAISTSSDRTVERSTTAYSTRVLGVYATKPGVLLTEQHIDADRSDRVPMGVIGVIPTKVTGENGPIRRGDLLVTSSIPGHAMRAGDNPPSGTVIGKALENFDGTTGVIEVFVNVK
jgi:hypothetical protein